MEEIREENNIIIENKEEAKTVKKDKNCNIIRIIFDCVVIALIAVLFVLHFTDTKERQTVFAPVPEGTPASGEIVYVNIDSINANYKLVEILTNDIDAEKKRQEVIFSNRQSALEKKYAQFQQNYQANVLTPVQIQNAQEQLMSESETLQQEYEVVFSNLQNRQMSALQQIADSLMVATKRVNAARNASYIFTYQYGGQLLSADPSKDITPYVLEELNKSFGKK